MEMPEHIQAQWVELYCCTSCKWKLQCVTTGHPQCADWNEIAHDCEHRWTLERESGKLWKDI